MDTDKEGVIHNTEFLEKLRVSTYLLSQERPLLRTQLQRFPPIYPVQILEHRSRIHGSPFLGILPPHRTTFQIVCLMYILMWGEQIVHNDEMDLPSMGKLHTVQSIEARQQGMGVGLHVGVVSGENSTEELVLGVVNSLNDKAIVPGEVEE